MNNEQIKQLETELWGAADGLRANSKLTAAEYKDPVLGLILLRYAQNRYEEAKIAIEAAIPDGPRGKRAATQADFLGAGAMMLPEKSQYGYLANLPEGEDINEAVNEAMRLIEASYPDLAGILPKNYQELDAELLRELIRVFNKDSVKKLKGDVFGRIYEFFLMKFSMSGAGAQEGGEFFTPPSLVQLIVNFIEPDHGIIHDPACGSGGMFVQTGHFVEDHSKRAVNEAIKVYGTELKSNNTRLAKMNLAIHGIEGKIIESNSFYSDPHDLAGKCDFVMANPPFNVNKVDKNKDFVKTDKRLFSDVGLPKADNGNYLWIQYFYHYLNEKGRAGFVMASSATDAGASEKLIRQKLIETGAVDCIVAVGNNFFYTRSLPCHLWFLDRGKRPENKRKILMIDARNTFRQINTTLRDFSADQMEGLTAIVKAYRGEDVSKTFASNPWLKEHFPSGIYTDAEGLCKIVDLAEVEENDWSLTPGRYVGYSIELDEGFDYTARLGEIHGELATLNDEATNLMQQIVKGGGMMKGWKSGVIKDYGQVVTGHTPPTAQKEYSGEGYKFVTPTDLNFMNYFVDQTGSQVTEAARKKFGKKFLPPYSVSYTCIGNTIGKACLNREWVLTNQQINSIIPSKEHDYRFIYYQLNCLKDTIVGAATGAATPIINKSKFEGIKVKYPPLPVQQKIGSLLAAYDDLIENNLKRIKLLEEMAQITYEEWFVRLHFPGHEATPINPETGLPEEWEIKKVGSLIGKAPKSAKIKSSEIKNSGSIPVVDQSKDFVAGYTDDPESLINANHPVIIFGDHTRVLKFINFPFARGADGTQVIISNDKRMPQHLFYHALLNLDLSNYHYARHYKFLKELEVIVPDLNVASEYEQTTKGQFEAVKSLRQQNHYLREARDILLPRLMTGVIDVENYNPAQLLKEAA